jgi:hypothetical protein
MVRALKQRVQLHIFLQAFQQKMPTLPWKWPQFMEVQGLQLTQFMDQSNSLLELHQRDQLLDQFQARLG